ncbi:LysR family transcriptional regulator [Leeia oryzae]|uniref:LysR family transcriptional regulator n=1 Tax=Leeia oryzae TaxID=356662 RepID=UPI00037ED922|nr:LysR family transcriptional regulator [Leeia oryzae]
MRTPQDISHHLSELALLVSVVEAGSFSEAARQNGLSPSAVSRQIGRLERLLEVRLFERSTRQLRLTDSGQDICRHAKQMLSAARAAADSAKRHATTIEGRVRLSAPKAMSLQLVHPHLPALLAEYLGLDLELLVSDQPVDLISGGVDIAIRLGDPPVGVVARPLMELRTLLCASPEYLARHGTPTHPEQLLRHSCLHLGEAPDDDVWSFQSLTGHVAGRVSVQIRGRYASNHSEIRRDAALRGLGIACLPDFTVTRMLADKRLVQVLPDWRLLGRYQGTVWLIYSADRYRTPRVKLMVDVLLKHIGGKPVI